MANSYKTTLPLAQIVPSKENPRKDFGDIDALAGAIRATGGQPVNPVVVVHDGDVYRIIDGERRYRAMLEVAGEGGSVDALVYDDYSEAHAAVAMLATDDKQQLTDVERAHGFQTMLRLGVEEQTMARATRRSVAAIRKAKTVATEAPEQATLDQMIAAADFEGEWRERMLAARCRTYEDVQRVVKSIEYEQEREKEWQDMLDALAEYGVKLSEKAKGPKGCVSKYCYSATSTRDMLSQMDPESLRGIVATRVNTYTSAAYIWVPKSDDRPEETDEDRAARLAEERRAALYEKFRIDLAKDQCTCDYEDCSSPLLTAAGALFRERQSRYDVDDTAAQAKRHGLDVDAYKKYVARSPMSNYELIDLLLSPHACIEWYDLVADLMPVAEADGALWVDDDFAWLLEQALQARQQAELSQSET